MTVNLEKEAGILDTPKEELAPDVWTKDQRLRPEIEKQIYSKLLNVLPADDIKHVLILGSLTGYKYNEKSDLDASVFIKPYEDAIGKTYLTRQINGDSIAGGTRPLSFFISEWFEDSTLENFKEVSKGVYSVTERRWITPPGRSEDILDPENQYKIELKLARAIRRKFEKYVKDWKRDLLELKKIKKDRSQRHQIASQEKEVQMGRERLKDIIRQADKQRKMYYDIGWGTARDSVANVVFKELEYSPYRKTFKKLREEVDRENIERANV